MELGDLLSKAASTIRVGGKETLKNLPTFACSDQVHEPFHLQGEPAPFHDKEEPRLWGVVSTSGAQFDGDRTDIHDVFALVWGAVLRAFGLSSAWLIDESHGFVRGEIGARHLLFQQCPWNISGDSFETARKSMTAWSAFAFHLSDDVFKWGRSARLIRSDSARVCQTEQPKWADQIIKYLRFPKDVLFSKRTFPLWLYFGSQNRGVTIIRMPKVRMYSLRAILKPFAPKMTRVSRALVIFANGIPNAVPYALVKKAPQATIADRR